MVQALVVLGVVAAEGAAAQTDPNADPLARPLVGNAAVAGSPLYLPSAGNQSRFSIVPSVRTVYDSNVLRYRTPPGEPGDNVRVTPGIDITLRRAFGRVAVSVDGTAGYDFNSRYRFLNSSRVVLSGNARAPVGAVCSFALDGRYQLLQFDFGDTQETGSAISRTQTYTLAANCGRLTGFSPVAAVSYTSLGGNGPSYFDYKQYGERVGVSFTRPSLGTLTLLGSMQQLRRPDFLMLTGSSDGTDVRSLTLGLNRSVSPRIHLNVSAGITQADPKRASVGNFTGASYDGTVEWLITPRFVVTGTASRAVTNQNGVSATYVVRQDVSLGLNWRVTAASGIRIGASRTERDFRGETLIPLLRPIGADETTRAFLGYSFEGFRRIRMGFEVSHRWRDADNPFYNYKATQVSTSIGARF